MASLLPALPPEWGVERTVDGLLAISCYSARAPETLGEKPRHVRQLPHRLWDGGDVPISQPPPHDSLAAPRARPLPVPATRASGEGHGNGESGKGGGAAVNDNIPAEAAAVGGDRAAGAQPVALRRESAPARALELRSKLLVGVHAVRHIFKHSIQLEVVADPFTICSRAFGSLSFTRADLHTSYFTLRPSVYFNQDTLQLCDSLSTPIYELVEKSTAVRGDATVFDAVSRAPVARLSVARVARRDSFDAHKALLVWARHVAAERDGSSLCGEERVWLIVRSDMLKRRFRFVEVGTNRIVAVASRSTKPFARSRGQVDEFRLFIAPFVDSALLSLCSVMMARFLCV